MGLVTNRTEGSTCVCVGGGGGGGEGGRRRGRVGRGEGRRRGVCEIVYKTTTAYPIIVIFKGHIFHKWAISSN